MNHSVASTLPLDRFITASFHFSFCVKTLDGTIVDLWTHVGYKPESLKQLN